MCFFNCRQTKKKQEKIGCFFNQIVSSNISLNHVVPKILETFVYMLYNGHWTTQKRVGKCQTKSPNHRQKSA